MLLGWTAQLGNHKVLIGVPSYEDAPGTSDPQVENITNATLGVRSALEDLGGGSDSFQGIAIYANWVTDASEWQELRNTWFPGSSGSVPRSWMKSVSGVAVLAGGGESGQQSETTPLRY